jgi:carbon monoxide dehydrogenase subunit G
MRLDGTKILALPRDAVWRALNDPAFLARTIPGCSKVEETTPDTLTMALTASVGPIRVSFDVALQRLEVRAPESYVLQGSGSGGVAGSATGRVRVRLDDVPGGTQLAYEAETEITGRIAQLGARLIDSTARKFAEEFFANVVRELTGPATAAEGAAAAAEGASAASPQPAGPVAQPTAQPAPVPARLPAPAGVPVGPLAADARLVLDGLAWRVALGCAVGSFLGTVAAVLLLRAAA